METATDFLTSLHQRGIALTLAGKSIRYRAPAGVVTERDRQALREHKAELLALLAATSATKAPEEEDTLISSPAQPRPATSSRRRGPKEQFSHDVLPSTSCPACSGRRWRLRSTPQVGGEWLWTCAACADAVQAAAGV